MLAACGPGAQVYISLYLPTSPHIPLYLPAHRWRSSPYTSLYLPYLPISPSISLYLPGGGAGPSPRPPRAGASPLSPHISLHLPLLRVSPHISRHRLNLPISRTSRARALPNPSPSPSPSPSPNPDPDPNPNQELSLDNETDSPFAILAKDNDICWGGGRPDDITVIVSRVIDPTEVRLRR